jgi:hypothetical protein
MARLIHQLCHDIYTGGGHRSIADVIQKVNKRKTSKEDLRRDLLWLPKTGGTSLELDPHIGPMLLVRPFLLVGRSLYQERRKRLKYFQKRVEVIRYNPWEVGREVVLRRLGLLEYLNGLGRILESLVACDSHCVVEFCIHR